MVREKGATWLDSAAVPTALTLLKPKDALQWVRVPSEHLHTLVRAGAAPIPPSLFVS